MNSTSIEWCNRPETRGPVGAKTWNPVRARLKGAAEKARSGTFCTRISPGCTHCYASTINKRFGNGLEFTVPNLEKIEFFIDERILEEPLRTKKPCTIFAGDMNDLFHEAIPFSLISQVLKVACEAKWHTLQFLTKRADRMCDFFSQWHVMTRDFGPLYPHMWPQNHIWLGVSVEDKQRAAERIPFLQATPAAVRFLSVEPQLEEVTPDLRGISWVICGGESGPGARAFNLAWAESLLMQCRAADVPFFMKQVGSRPICQDCCDRETHFCGIWKDIKDRKGGDPSEWPHGFRVREFPAPRARMELSA